MAKRFGFPRAAQVRRVRGRRGSKAPDRLPFSGRFNLRLPPDLHRSLVRAAARSGKSLNAWAVEALRRAAEDESA